MSGESDREGLHTIWSDYVYGHEQLARWDAARIEAAARINGWPGVWAEWAKTGGTYRRPTEREIERMIAAVREGR